MKKILGLILIASAALIAVGCAHINKESKTTHEFIRYGVVAPPDWKTVSPIGEQELSNGIPIHQKFDYADFLFLGVTNQMGFFSPRPLIYIASDESWVDKARGGGTFLFTDPQASQINNIVNNQPMLGGGHTFSVGAVSSQVTTNDTALAHEIGATTANIVGTVVTAITGSPGGTISAAAKSLTNTPSTSAVPSVSNIATNLP